MRQLKTRRWRRYTTGDAETLPLIEQMTPTRAPTLESDVLVPVAQGVLFGLVIGSAMALVAWAGWNVALWPWWPVATTVVAGLALSQRLLAMQDTLFRIESFVDADLDGDDEGRWDTTREPEVVERLVTLRGPETENATRLLERSQFEEQFSTFIRGCEAGSTAMSRWEKPLGRDVYIKWRDALIDLEWAAWQNPDAPKQGWDLKFPAQDIIEAVHIAPQFARKFD